MNVVINKIVTIRDQIDHLLPTMGIAIDSTATLESVVSIGSYLDCFSPIDIFELISVVSYSKPSPCLLDPVPSKVFK